MIQRRSILKTACLAIPSVVACPLYAAQDKELAIGLSLPLTGPQAEVAKDLLAGYELAVKSTGSKLRLKVLDDESSPEKTAANMTVFAASPEVIVVSGIVGTPHAQAALPVLAQAGIPVVGIRSGASILRSGQPGVYHLRASFEDELDKVARTCQGAGINNLIIVYSDDSFGKSSKAHLTQKVDSLGMKIMSSYAVNRNGEKMSEALELVGADVKRFNVAVAVVLLLIAKPMVQAAQELRINHHVLMPTYALSFVATRSLMNSTEKALSGLGLVTAFPLARTIENPLAHQFKTDIKNFNAMELSESLTAIEGYF